MTKVERLVNLTVALLDARRPMTLAEIREKLPGYGQEDPESARRMFERDKNDLRRLGVPVETRALDAFEAEWGYLIDHEAYALPDVDLDVAEVTALAVTLQVAGDEDARRGFTKLAALAPDPRRGASATQLVPFARVDVDVDMLDGLADALVERRTVRFEYRTSTGERALRRVDPYGVVQRRGAWYLVGRDHDRDDLRVFRFDRFAGAVDTASEPGAFEVPDDLDLVAATAGPASSQVDARVAFTRELEWDVRRRGGDIVDHDDGQRIIACFSAVDAERFLPWVLGFGAEAEVMAPTSLREEARRRLEAVTEAIA